MAQKEIRVAALMTAPRYECVTARSAIERAMNAAGIPLTISGGVFYGQCMQSMMEGLMDGDKPKVDYIITVDFDSMFTATHITRLLSIIAQEDQVDALAALQPMRGKGRMLGSRYDGATIEWDGRPIKVDSAHFGLTIIDAEKLLKLEKPWFWSQPDENGSWNDGRVDSDVWFWRQWERAGNSVYIDPGTRLGHLEELVSYYDDKMNLLHTYPKDWKELAATTVDL